MEKTMRIAFLIVVSLLLACCAPVQMVPPGPKPVVTGAAGGGTPQKAGTSFEQCTESFGTLALAEEQDEDWHYVIIHEYGLPPASKLLRLMAQQSNCFVVVERDRQDMKAMEKERAPQDSGEMRQGGSFGKGQIDSADYTLTPSVIFSSHDLGSIGAAVGTRPRPLDDSAGTAVGAVDGVKKREASTLLTLVDNRSGVLIEAAEGNASNLDFGLLDGIFSGSGGVGLGGYEKTPEGKILAAAFADSFNQMVKALKNYQAQEVKGDLGKGGNLKVGS
jgi:curli biogenesis system outer membrane secretion channel CsgG